MKRGVDTIVRGGRVVTASDVVETAVAITGDTIVAIGPEALLFTSYAQTRPDFAAVHGGSGDIRYDYLRSLANSIEGGTSEILRNVLGERVLGLPPEPREDKDIPWTKVLKP